MAGEEGRILPMGKKTDVFDGMVKRMGNRLGKIAVWGGSTLTLLAIGGAGTVTYPSYTAFYYSAAIGLSLIVGGLLTVNLPVDEPHDAHPSC